MVDAIIPLKKPKVKPVNYISDERFKELINGVYAIMLDYTRIRKKPLTKSYPIQVGNVAFWFESNNKKEPQLKFSHSVKAWDEAAIVRDLDQHFHDLHFLEVRT